MLVSIAILMISQALLAVQISDEDTFDCTGHKDDSVHPMADFTNCRYYWHCIYVDTVYMRAMKRVCPAGTEFNVQSRACEIPSLANCATHTSPITTSTQKYRSFSARREETTVQVGSAVHPEVTKIILPQELEVLTTDTPPSEYDSLIARLLQNLIALQLTSADHNHEFKAISLPTATTDPPFTSEQWKNHSPRRRRHNNRMLNILTSDDHKIQHFFLNQTHGLLIHCNEIRRRHLRDLVYRTTTTTTHTPHIHQSLPSSSSPNTPPCDICSFTLLIGSVLFLQKINAP